MKLTMDTSDRLSTDEVAKAASLAEELFQEDVERRSVVAAAEEVGIPPEYLERATQLLKAEKVEHRKRAAKRRNAVIAATCIIVTGASINLLLSRLHPVETPYTTPALSQSIQPKTAPVSHRPKVPLASLYSVGLVPVNTMAPIMVRSGNVGPYATSITFSNLYGEPVNVYEMQKSEIETTGGAPVFRFSLKPGETRMEDTAFGHPWLVTDKSNRNLGLFFPSSSPSLAAIQSKEVIQSLTDVTASDRQYDFPGYLQPLNDNIPTAPAGKAHGMPTAIEIVNLHGESVDVFQIGNNGARTFKHDLPSGMNFVSEASTSDLWVVSGQDGQIVARFRPNPIPMTGIVWPN